MQYDCYVTMEMQQSRCYTTGTITSLWKCSITHCYTTGTVTLLWKCHQGLIYHNIMSPTVRLRHRYITSSLGIFQPLDFCCTGCTFITVVRIRQLCSRNIRCDDASGNSCLQVVNICLNLYVYKRARMSESGYVNSSSSNLRRQMAPVISTSMSRKLIFVIGFASRELW
jgi:hypothetical protein